jgi:sialic acid synthase SpsE
LPALERYLEVAKQLNDEKLIKDTEFNILIAKNLVVVREKFGRGLSLKKSLKKGEIARADIFTLKKPLGPLSWDDRIGLVGKQATKDLDSRDHLSISDFE